MKTFRVKITKASHKEYWYVRHIGEIFWVQDDDDCSYVIIDNEYPSEGVYIGSACIDEDDCEVIDYIAPRRTMTKVNMV